MLKHIFLHNQSILIVACTLLFLAASVQQINHLTPAEAAITPQQENGHIIVQLFQVPGFISPSINGEPRWTLYDDGLLIFQTNDSLNLLQAHLSPASVHTIMNVILQQNHFFDCTKSAYGRFIPDTGSLLLSVDSNGQHKQVQVYAKPDLASSDVKTRHIFAILDFLLNYYPESSSPYTPPAIALLAIPQQSTATGIPAWPYKDLSLAKIAVLECPLLSSSGCPTGTRGKIGIAAISGQRGLTLLQNAHNPLYTHVQEQGKEYRLVVWPLLPDALIPHHNAAPSIEIQGSANGNWPLYISSIRRTSYHY